MTDACVYITDDLLFFFIGSAFIYLFVLVVASHLKRVDYSPSKRQYRYAILVPPQSVLPSTHPQHQFIVYDNLVKTIDELDEMIYDVAIILDATVHSLPDNLLSEIDKVYDAGIQAVQLHTVAQNRKGIHRYLSALQAEINNSLFCKGNSRLGLSSTLIGTNMAIDLQWIQEKLKSNKTNLERKLLIQHIYIEYLPDVTIPSESPSTYLYKRRKRKAVSDLLPSLLEGNWSFFNRIVQQLMPPPLFFCIFTSIWMLFMTGYEWPLSLKWWILLFLLLVTYSLAIPDYLIEDKNKKSLLWKITHSNRKSSNIRP